MRKEERDVMKVGIIADTHDNLPYVRKALTVFGREGCEAIIHAGDYVAPFALKALLEFPGRVYGVLGNNDGERSGLRKLMPELNKGPLKVTLGGCRITAIHQLARLSQTDRAETDVIVCGHTHLAEITDGRPLVINPGECAGWLTGHSTVVILETETRTAELVDLGAWA